MELDKEKSQVFDVPKPVVAPNIVPVPDKLKKEPVKIPDHERELVPVKRRQA